MLSHLLELRRRLLHILACFAMLFLLFYCLSPDLFHTLMMPLLHALPADNSLIATQVTAPVFIPIKLAANAAMLCTAPFALYHAWRFASPGLYQQERQQLRGIILGSLLLFCTGILFCFYVVLPFMFQFFAHIVPTGVRLMPDMLYALNFITRMLLLFGLCFQVPLLCLTLTHVELIDVTTLKKIRPYVIVGSFTIGMLLTPPDVISQIMLAVPICLLYELGIVLVKLRL